MTTRSFIVGLVGALLMGALGQYVNKYVPGIKGLVRGHLPVSVFGLFILFVLLVNPLLARIRSTWRFRAGEIAVVLAMILMACGITDAGLMRHFPRILIHPIQQNRTFPGWQRMQLLEKTPPILLANRGRYSEEVVDNYVSAMGNPGQPISIRRVPWHAWWKPLLFWSSLIYLLLAGVISLSVVIHRQWAERERIRYPVAQLASTLLMQDSSGRPLILRERLFWLGLLAVLFVRITTGLHLWLPGSIEIPLELDFSALSNRLPKFMNTPGASSLATVKLIPACIGFSYLLASEIGLSVGIANVVSVSVLYLMLVLGADLSGGAMTGNVADWASFGSFFAMGVMLLYFGRRYFWDTFKGALGLKQAGETQPESVQALRMFFLCALGCVLLLWWVGLDLPLAVLGLAVTLLLFVVITRVNAECGTFFFAPGWMLPGVAVGLYGASNLGPRMLIILGLLTYVFSIDPFECLMPYVNNGLKIASDTMLAPGRVGLALAAALLLVLAITIPTAVWADYNWPAEMERGWDSTPLYNAAERIANEINLSGRAALERSYTAWERLLHIRPDPRFLLAAGTGFALMVVFVVLRLRYTWWPLHPVLILAFGAGLLYKFCASFLLGWLIKVVIMRLAGVARYNRCRPLMMGLIVGDLSGSFLIMLVSWVYFLVTGVQSPAAAWLPW
ncbi:MAG: DUF6785 family protein [Kiritimatiellia bacterium]